jgi:ElaB/YqjD/DUF883 family membrane-anchored ribosome-binding protein
MDQGLATLIAAIVAALASLLTLLTAKPTEIRAANRKTLEAIIYDLSTSVHQLIATSNILLKNKSEESRDNWKEKAETAKKTLKEIRPKIRYALWGIDESLQTLTRLPDFTLYTLADIDVAKKVVRRGSRLGDAIDKCIRDCYLNGRAPTFYERWTIKFLDWHFRKARDNYKGERKTGA